MTEPNSYIPQESPNLEFVYNNESELKSFYWPLFWSEYEIPQQANQLFNDYDSDYITYSGDSWKSLMVSKEKDGRYKNFTLRAYSGDSFNFYLSAGSLVDGVETYYSGPLTTSGNYSVLTSYSGQSTAEANAVSFTAPGDNTTVYTFPQVSTINFVKLYHQASTVSGEYRLYQFLPRTLIQVDDLEADVISAVTVRVQDSIVIGPDMIGDKTLLGRKIVDGTLSGILLTDGTITGSKIQANTISGALITAGTITADRIASKSLTASQIADAAITGNLIQAGTVSGVLITDNAISASKIQANTITGDKIVAGTISGSLITANTITGNKIVAATISGSLITAGAITSDKINVTNLSAVNTNTGNLSVNGTLTVTSGVITAGLTRIDSNGIDIDSTGLVGLNDSLRIIGSGVTGGITGMSWYNRHYSSTAPVATMGLDSVNVLSISMPRVGTGNVIQFDFDNTYGGQVKILEGGLDLLGGDLFVYNSTGTSIVSSLDNSGVIQVSDGSVSAPTLSFRNDPDTGFYRAEDNAIRIATGGNFTGLFSTNQLQMASGTEALPAYTFINDNDTGMYRRSANNLALAAGGTEAIIVGINGLVLVNTLNSNGQLTIEVPNGTARTVTTLRQLNDASAYINFVSNTVTASTPIQTSALGAYAGKVRVQINGVVRWIPFYQ